MEVSVGKDIFTVELVAKEVTLQEYIHSKVNEGGREVRGKDDFVCGE